MSRRSVKCEPVGVLPSGAVAGWDRWADVAGSRLFGLAVEGASALSCATVTGTLRTSGAAAGAITAGAVAEAAAAAAGRCVAIGAGFSDLGASPVAWLGGEMEGFTATRPAALLGMDCLNASGRSFGRGGMLSSFSLRPLRRVSVTRAASNCAARRRRDGDATER